VDAVGVRDEVDFCSEEYGPGHTKGRRRGVSWTYTKTFCVGIAEGRKEHYRIWIMTENKNNRGKRNKIEIYVPIYGIVAVYVTQRHNFYSWKRP